MNPLTPREIEVGRLLADGLTFEEIGEKLRISPSTVRSHATALRFKLGVSKSRYIPGAMRRKGYF